MPALALTDHGNLFGAVDFYKLCKEHKVKPILGCEIYLAPTSRHEKKKLPGLPVAFHLTLLAKNKMGYKNLCKLSSLGYTEGFYYSPRIDFELLQKHAEGLICLSGCMQSPFAYQAFHGNEESLSQLLLQYKALFQDDFYIELQRHRSSTEDLQLDGVMEEAWLFHQYQEYVAKQDKLNTTLYELGKKHAIGCVATNNCHYLERQDFKAHEILINVQSGESVELWQDGKPIPNPKRTTFPSHELYMKSAEEMQELFSDIPEAIQTTCAIAEKCLLELDFSTKHYPVFIPPSLQGKTYSPEERNKSVVEFLHKLCEDAIPKRYTEEKLAKVKEKYPDQDPLDVVKKRLNYEMSVIAPKGMCDYLLIVWDFIHWAKNRGIPMGPGRGSGAGSIVCYLTGITDIEPLRFNLFFERFINPERVSYPDIDVDICMERRPDVINYTMEKYGKNNVAQIITFGTMKAKMVVRDVGRVLNIPLPRVNSIAKMIPDDLNITIEKALEKDHDLQTLYQTDPIARKVLDIGQKLEGCIRSYGTHAAGIIISGEPLTEHIPICIAKDSDMLSTQYAMKPVELVGMLKIDFLGLKTLTCLRMCQDAIKTHRNETVDWTNLPLDDSYAFSLLNQGKTQGIFQIETGGMQELAKQLHLDKFEEIIAVLSLYRPGPMDMIPSFIARKHKREPIEYDHPWLGEILSETYGIMVYQEQVMQIASRLANFSLGEGDVLRRAMGKKDTKEMAKLREKFITGCTKNGINDATAGKIFDKMEKFAEYGFNKSHAAAYGYLTYVTAYFKARYPKEWLASLMTCDRDDIVKVAKFTSEGRQMHIPMLPPDINESYDSFTPTQAGIRFAMSGIKGVGIAIVESIIQERKAKGPFTSLYNFIQRMDMKRIGKKTVEIFIDAGAFDFTKWHRDAMKASLDAMFQEAERSQKDRATGTLSLFQTSDESESFLNPPKLTTTRSKEDLLFREKELLGFFVTGHPFDAYTPIMKRLGCQPFSALEKMGDNGVIRTVCVIDDVSIKVSSKTHRKFAILSVSDIEGHQHEVPIWSDLFEEKQQHLVANKLIIAVMAKEKKYDEESLSCKWLSDLKTCSEATLHECDSAYDKAKFTPKARYGAPKDASTRKPKDISLQPAPQPAHKAATIALDLDLLKASHIIKLQQYIHAAPRGDTHVELVFHASEQEVARLTLHPKWAIALDQTVQEQLKSFERLSSN
jgi:DNA polymerase-3 subunit alpha